MRPIQAVTGLLIIVIGVVAAITGEFAAAGSWLLAVALAALGLTGLLAGVATTISGKQSDGQRSGT